MKHLLELLKIIDGGVNADPAKVVAYARQLATKLEGEGDAKSATRIRRAISGSKAQKLSLARGGLTEMEVPVDGESRVSLADENFVLPHEVGVVLEPNAAAEVDRFLRFIRSADELVANGVGIAPTLLLHGPPGCGKTEVGRYIASRLELPLLTARTDGLISSYLGSTAKNLRRLFEHAQARPCVLFLDEFDALAKLRDDQHEQGELKRVVVSLLQNIDALQNETTLVAATNHEHLLDPAVWRRFAFRLKLDCPTTSSRETLFSLFLGDFTDDASTKLFALASEGLTGADIRQICEDAKRDAILEGCSTVDTSGMLRSILSLSLPAHEREPLGVVLSKARNACSKVYTIRRLADIFGLSVGKVHKELRARPNA